MTHPNMRVFRVAMGLAALISIVALVLYLLASSPREGCYIIDNTWVSCRIDGVEWNADFRGEFREIGGEIIRPEDD